MQHLEVVVGQCGVVVGVYIIYLSKAVFHEFEKFLVGVDDDDGVLLSDESALSWSNHVSREFFVGVFKQVYLATVVKLQSLLCHCHGLGFRIFEIHLHFRHSCDDLQHLEM